MIEKGSFANLITTDEMTEIKRHFQGHHAQRFVMGFLIDLRTTPRSLANFWNEVEQNIIEDKQEEHTNALRQAFDYLVANAKKFGLGE